MDARQKKILVILIAACPILIWRLVALTDYLPASARATVAAPMELEHEALSDIPEAMTATVEDYSTVLKAQEAIELQPWGRDPFAILGDLEPPQPEAAVPDKSPPRAPLLRFTGVSKSGDRWIAVVQGGFVGVGDVVEQNYRVVEIAKGAITLESEGWMFRYELGAEAPVVRPVRGTP